MFDLFISHEARKSYEVVSTSFQQKVSEKSLRIVTLFPLPPRDPPSACDSCAFDLYIGRGSDGGGGMLVIGQRMQSF